MQVQRFDPFSVLARMDREFDELVRRGWGTGGRAGVALPSAMAGFVPPVELVRDGEDVVVRLELPGVDVERDLSIEVERGKLVISGERRDSHSEQSGVIKAEPQPVRVPISTSRGAAAPRVLEPDATPTAEQPSAGDSSA